MKSIFRLLVCFTFISLASSLLAEPELKGLPDELSEYLKNVPKTVMVSGESEIKMEADKATVSLRIRTENKSFQESLRLNQGIRSKVIAFLIGRDVAADKIQAAKFSSAPKYAVFSDKVKAYTVENILKITVRDEKEFQAVASAADNWPEVHYEGAEFEQSNKDELKMKALRQACENATARKKIFEETLGVRLVAKRFFENAVSEPVWQNRTLYSGAYEESSKAKGLTGISAQSGTAPAAVIETMSSFGELTFKAKVAVEYSLEGK
ncbi:MAG: SIMPL domain-containing protein [Verrucomicrobiota bacterium]